MRDGLKLALDLNIKNLEMETDALMLKHLILSNENDFYEFYNFIVDCRSFLAQLGVKEINHV
ncbi:hypothetical protein ACSBR2_002795 [Camellia fascicularis]